MSKNYEDLSIPNQHRVDSACAFLNEAKEECVAKMLAALTEWVQSCPEMFVRHAGSVKHAPLHELNAEEAIAELVEDIASGYIHPCQTTLESLVGEIEEWEARASKARRAFSGLSASAILFDALKPPTAEQIERLRGPVTNPQTYADKGEPL